MAFADIFSDLQAGFAVAVFLVYGLRWLARGNGEKMRNGLHKVAAAFGAALVLSVGIVLVYSFHDPDALDILKTRGRFITLGVGLTTVYYAALILKDNWPK